MAAGICYLAQLDAEEQQRCFQEMRDRAMLVTQKSKAALSSASNFQYSFSTSKHVRIGTALLKNHDPAGAVSMCKIAAENHPSDIKAWVCLGEARLALHNGAWTSGLVEQQSRLVFDRLKLARDNFAMAVNMNQGATCAKARLGLGLSLFLSATRKGADASGRQAGGESSSQLLFDSILHLNAAAFLTSPSMPLSRGESADERAIVHMAAKYNSAIANLALGDFSSPIAFMKDIDASLEEKGLNGLYVTKTNIAAMTVQRGNHKKATPLLESLHDKCVLEPEDSSEEQEIKKNKLCAIIQNNFGVTSEASGFDYEASYIASIASEKYLHVRSGFGSVNHGEALHDAVSMESILYAHGDLLVNTSYLENRMDSQSVQDAVLALEEAATKNPNQPRLWILLSKAKLRAGDRIGAIEAGTKALNAANTVEEIEAANSLLDEALTRTINVEMDVLTTHIAHLERDATERKRNDVEVLRLEREILNLKLQLLQHSLESADGFKFPLVVPDREVVDDALIDNTSELNNTSKQSIADDEPVEELGDKGHEENTVEDDGISSGADDLSPVRDTIRDNLEDQTSTDTQEEASMGEQSTDDMKEETNLESQDSSEPDYEQPSDSNQGSSVDERSADDEELQSDLNISDEIVVAEAEVIGNTSDTDTGADNDADNDADIGILEKPKIDLSEEENVQVDETKVSDKVLIAGSDTRVSISEEPVAEQSEQEDVQVDKIESTIATEIEIDEELAIEEEIDETIEVPELYTPIHAEIEAIPDAAQSYMKMADAYLQKENFKLASKQFLKVLKKAPHHIPAILGYASSLERFASPRQKEDVAIAYTNVTRSALIQGNENLAHASFRRAVSVSRDMDGNRVGVLNQMADTAFTYDLAADIHYELGIEMVRLQSEDSLLALRTANEYSRLGSEDGNGFHPKSTLHLGKNALDFEKNPRKASVLLQRALTSDLAEMTTEALLYLARSKIALNDSTGAIQDLKNAVSIEIPQSESSAEAHYFLAIVMKEQNMGTADIEHHMEIALNMGKELTSEANEILGEHNMAVIKSTHRAEWKRYQEEVESGQEQRGGIMNGGGVSGNSIFSSKTDSGTGPEDASDTLSMLEQRASTYDGSSVPMGDESEADSISINSSNQSRARATV